MQLCEIYFEMAVQTLGDETVLIVGNLEQIGVTMSLYS